MSGGSFTWLWSGGGLALQLLAEVDHRRLGSNVGGSTSVTGLRNWIHQRIKPPATEKVGTL